jgi:hypothetical protein
LPVMVTRRTSQPLQQSVTERHFIFSDCHHSIVVLELETALL